MRRSARIPLYITDEHQCDYLVNEVAQTAFVDPKLIISESLYSSLNQQGFRRSGSYLYKPDCDDCSACLPLRIDAREFTPSRSQKRCIKKNQNLQAHIKSEVDIWPYYPLYSKYIEGRHRDGEMYPPKPEQFESFLGYKSRFVRYVEFRDGDELLMVSVMDQMSDALSAIYTFFDPDHEDRGLGNFAILWQLDHAKVSKIPFVYLGHWIEQCDKMSYKTKYASAQILKNEKWTDI